MSSQEHGEMFAATREFISEGHNVIYHEWCAGDEKRERELDAERDASLSELGQAEAVIRAALALVELKDGPRNEAYEAAKNPAWIALRSALAAFGSGEGTG